MDECFRGCCSVVFDFFDCKVGICGDADGWVAGCSVDVDDDEDWVWNKVSEKFVDGEIGTTEFGAGMIPSDDLFTGCCQGGTWEGLPLIFLNMVFMSSM